jgi:hypothetical protein
MAWAVATKGRHIMLSWFRRKDKTPPKAPPTKSAANPGVTVEGRVGFANAQRSWEESFDCAQLVNEVLTARGMAVDRHKTWLVLPDSGFVLQPLLVELKPLEGGGVNVCTTVEASHPMLAPHGVFEFQHAAGKTTQDAIRKGFDQWAQTDLVVLLDALKPTPATCTILQMDLPEREGRPAKRRRAILGPVAHYRQHPPAAAAAAPAGADEQEHDFCPCCLLTHTYQAYQPLLEADGFYGIRFFAMRNEEGEPMADCRVNGEDHEAGAAALRDYVRTWPQAGVEFRKQYVVLQDRPTPA